jgi:adiponectin receptor
MSSDAPQVTTIDNVANWLVDNRYIYHGYRHNFSSFRQTLRSMFAKHNELVNIWTHLIGALVFLACLGYLFGHSAESKTLYTEIKHKFSTSDFVRSVYAHSHTVSDYFGGLGIDSDLAAIHQRLAELKGNYTLRYEALKADLIQQETFLLNHLNAKLEQTAHIVELTFNSWREKLHNLTTQANQRFTMYIDKIDTLLDIDSLIHFLEGLFDSPVEFYPVLVYTVCAITCLGLSAIFHSFFVMNPRVCKILQKCDYAGIIILIFGSSFSFFYYTFYCADFWRNFYVWGIGLFSVVTFVCSLSDYFDTQEGATFKAILMGGLGVSNFIPAVHMAALSLNPDANKGMLNFPIFHSFLRTGACYLGGLAIYISRFPEKSYPKKFDIWLNSHAIWHVFVFLGALSHYFAILRVYQGRVDLGCPA